MTRNPIQPPSFKLQALSLTLLLALAAAAVENPANVGVYSVPVSGDAPATWGELAANTELPVNEKSVAIINSLYDMVCERIDVPRLDYTSGEGLYKTLPYSTPESRSELADERRLDKAKFFRVFSCVRDYLENGDPIPQFESPLAPRLFPLSFGSIQSAETVQPGWQARETPAIGASNLDAYPGNVDLSGFVGYDQSGDIGTVAEAVEAFARRCGRSAMSGPRRISGEFFSGLCSLNGHSASEYLRADGMDDRLAYVVPYAANRILSALDTRWFDFGTDPLIVSNSFRTIVQTNVYILAGSDIASWISTLPESNRETYSTTFRLGATVPIVAVESETVKAADYFTSDEVLGFGETAIARAYVDYALVRHVNNGHWVLIAEDFLPIEGERTGYVRVEIYRLVSETTTEIGSRAVVCDQTTSVRTVHRKTVQYDCETADAVVASREAGPFVDLTTLFYGGRRTDTRECPTVTSMSVDLGLVDSIDVRDVSIGSALREINNAFFGDPEDETTRDEGRIPSVVVYHAPIRPEAVAASRVSYFKTRKFVWFDDQDDPEAGEAEFGEDFFERDYDIDTDPNAGIGAFFRGGGTGDDPLDDIAIGSDENDAENSRRLDADPIYNAPPGHIRIPVTISLEWPESSHVGNSVRHDYSQIYFIGKTRFKFIKW